ncbi:DUF2635 domain-containing protein [Aliivibrio sp. S4TY2]|uniref:DUF2635 domain-containing protein n=1 Tax=unclassified Aliivibrio TaxID=2645654 RepID=UPI002377EA74|nr:MULTISPECIES: DUF2635 domain-containing protein [unclassified Aliivibrio]MDD9158544.1 DUF2635 domain-containing protein [Aliivibrio sp. S4TY2]MDD9162544.1 DUF2635 domain-containing protein [Aliivibrio sp. S4TY1]MDD9166543.1 DUF2635 domain-containing protein [Aliivibrio sp. S4MY2]MDD9170544.1 DUF2635 domain-containing protein [Aliivibrio sp. S4MY4]MDD9187623.1 DUF2635 domain-containing protein [Aliivibrio sp. S4MY3]
MCEIKIKPATKGLLVRDPITRVPLDVKGEVKPRNSYWLRRIQDESVVVMTDKEKTGATS